MLREELERGHDVLDFVDHLILVAEKADTQLFVPEAMTGYDKAIKTRVVKYGKAQFVDSSQRLEDKHFGFINTKLAVAQKAAQVRGASGVKHSSGKSICKSFNLASGCSYNANCKWRHVCRVCYSSHHGQSDCGGVNQIRSRGLHLQLLSEVSALISW